MPELPRKSWIVREPDLEFGTGSLCPDPKAGLFMFGPPTPPDTRPSPSSIRLGIIGSGRTADLFKNWLAICRRPIAALRSGVSTRFDFPGFRTDSGFLCEAAVDDNLVSVIPQRILVSLPGIHDPAERLETAVEAIVDSLRNLSHREPPPTVTVIALPEEVIRSCVLGLDRFGRLKRPRSVLGRAYVRSRQVRIEDFLPGWQQREDDETGAKHYSNLRRAIKFEAWRLGMETQIIWQSTLEGRRGMQDLATAAWNFFVGLYYKASGHPWHLARQQVGTCYVGVSFFWVGTLDSGLDASVAQVFSHTGDGMVLRGDRAAYRDPDDRRPHLSQASARNLAGKALEHYRSQTKTAPARLVVHKSSRFTPEEREGFLSAADGSGSVDLVTLESSRFVFYRQGVYPPLRGAAVPLEGYGTLLYTKAYSPYLGTYPGPGVPRPIALLEHHGDSPVSTIAADILALTKLNWNSADFSSAMPITLQFSRRVGEVLSQGETKMEVKSRFSFFI